MKNKKAKDFHQEIHSLLLAGKTNPEIAEELGLTRCQVAIYVERNLGGNPNYLKKRSKHKHLHEKILTMRLSLSDAEIRKKLGLTESEMRSCMSSAYKKKQLKHLRKDDRRRDSWSSEELRFLLKFSGIIPQEDLAKILNRGKSRIVIKEKLQKLGLCSKNINGLTLSKFRVIFCCNPDFLVQTNAGSPSGIKSNQANWKIVPWCHIDELLDAKLIGCAEVFRTYVKTMATFQKWVHGNNYWASLTSEPMFKGKI